jgi:hypothetical protein
MNAPINRPRAGAALAAMTSPRPVEAASGPVRRLAWLALLAVAAFGVVGCGGGGDAPPLDLVAGSASHELVGRDGGSLAASSGGVTYRVIAPRGALSEDTAVSLTPIASLDVSPFEDGPLAAVSLEAGDAPFDWPLKLELSLGSGPANRLRAALDDGMIAVAFRYDEENDRLAGRIVQIDDDRARLQFDLFEPGVYGVAVGTVNQLKKLPKPGDPALEAEQKLARKLHELAGKYDLDQLAAIPDPRIRPELRAQLDDWLGDIVLQRVDDAGTDPAVFRDALRASIQWQRAAASLGFLNGVWYAQGDELYSDGLALSRALAFAYETAVRDANEQCRASGDPHTLIALIGTEQREGGLGLLGDRLAPILQPGAFCVTLGIDAVEAPASLTEGSSGSISFAVASHVGDTTLSPDDLALLGVEGSFTPVANSLVRLSSQREAVDHTSNRLHVDADARESRDGSDWEGSVELRVMVLGGLATHAEQTVRIDIKPDPER